MADETPASPAAGPPPDGLAFGHFVVPRRDDGSPWKLGEGAMGVTYRAFDTSLRVEVALKVITAARVNDEETRRRFQREARAAAKIRHPNVASVLYLGEEGGEFFYAMEFIAGPSLDALLKATAGPLPPVVAVGLAAQVAAALNAAHRREVVHRDLKPANLMLLEGEGMDQEDARTDAAGHRQVKVIDFGLARSFSAERSEESLVTQTASGFIGTPAYASPEQAAGEGHIDGRSDLYSLGIILWQMLAGSPPFRGKVVEVMRKHLFVPPPFEQLPAGLPASLTEIVRGLLVKEADGRVPQTAGELRNALDACLREWSAPPAPVPARSAVAPAAPPAGERGSETTVLAGGAPLVIRDLPPANREQPPNASRPLPAGPVPPAGGRRSAMRWLAALATAAGLLALGGIVLSRTNWLAGQPRPSPTPTAAPLPEKSPSLTAAPLPTASPSPTATAPPSVPPAPVAQNGATPSATVSPPPTKQDSEARRYLAEARTTANNITGDHDEAEALSAIAVAQAKAGDTAGAMLTAKHITDVSRKAEALRDIAIAQAKAGNVAGAKETTKAIRGDHYEILALCATAIAQAKAGNVAEAKETAKGITEEDYKIRTLGDIAIAQAKAGDVAGATETLRQAKTMADDITYAADKDRMLRDIAIAQAKAGDMGRAKTTARDITSAYYKTLASRDIASAQAKAGDMAGAAETFRQAKTTAKDITPADFEALALRDIAIAQAKAGDTVGAKVTARDITNAESEAWALCNIATAQAKAGDVAGAKATARDITDASYKARALRDIATAQAKAGAAAGASETLRLAKATTKDIAGANDKAGALAAIATAQAKAGYAAEASETLRLAKATTKDIAERYSKATALRDITTAQTWTEGFPSAEQWARTLTEPFERSLCYTTLAEATLSLDGPPDDED